MLTRCQIGFFLGAETGEAGGSARGWPPSAVDRPLAAGRLAGSFGGTVTSILTVMEMRH